MKRKPIISVITPSYNAAQYLPDLIESVKQQTYCDFEHIIIDDGSSDGGATKDLLSHYKHLRWWSRENKGQYYTQNEGIQQSIGDIIVIIAADDIFFSNNVFQMIVDHWESEPKCELVYGNTFRMDEKGTILPVLEINRSPSQWLIKQISYVQHCSLFVSKAFLSDNHLLFDPTFKYAGDWDWIIRLFKGCKKIGYIPSPISIIRIHQNQTSRVNTKKVIMSEHKRVCELHNGNYVVHVLFSKLINWRGMILLGWHKIHVQGFSAFLKSLISWGRKKLK